MSTLMEIPDNFHDLMNSLRGGITAEEGIFLYHLAAETRVGCIVEVGSFRGKSAVALAQGARAHEEAHRPAIYCIEPHRSFTGYYGGEFGPQDRGAFYETMLQTGTFKEVSLVNLSSEEVAQTWKNPVGLAFIDGDHRYIGVKRDFEYWDPHLLVGGIIVFDDAIDPSCGPYQLIQEILRAGRYVQVAAMGKIIALKKISPAQKTGETPLSCQRRLLIACDHLLLSGGLLRFERAGNHLRSWGHEVAFVALGKKTNNIKTELPLLSMDQAAETNWDAVMIPGAGFPDETIELFSTLRRDNFGIRIQHVLNDPSRATGFKKVNRVFKPHIVIFNNQHWPVGSFTDFDADRFHLLLGGIDPAIFSPMPYRSHPLWVGKWIVGGQAGKNPTPLLEALAYLPPYVTLRLFGNDSLHLADEYASLVNSGRLELVGPLLGDEALSCFYYGVDCVVMTETSAGWANLVVESMASGVPIVCTPHGTLAFAVDQETALVIEEPTPAAIAAGIKRLMDDSGLCANLAQRARNAIIPYSWDQYARGLLKLLEFDGSRHYIHSPEDGLYGKWPLMERLQGLEALLANAYGHSVIDFGAAEGMIAREFLKAGATKVCGFDLNAASVRKANALCTPWKDASFRVADLSDWNAFTHSHGDCIHNYDIVLYLGIHHHLPPNRRMEILSHVSDLANRYLAIRTTPILFESENINRFLTNKGFHLLGGVSETTRPNHLGIVNIYEKQLNTESITT